MTNWRDIEWDDVTKWPLWAKNTLYAMVILLGFIAGFILLIKPINLEITQEKLREQQLKTTFNFKVQQVAALPDIDEQVNQLEIFYQHLTTQLPDEGELAQLLASINDTGLKNHLQFQRLDWQKGEKIGWLYQLPLTMEISGDYQQIGQFAEELASLPRIVALQDFVLQRTSEKTAKYGKLDPQLLNVEQPLRLAVTAHVYRYADTESTL